MTIVLRPYQAELMGRVVDAFNSGTRTAVLQLGTGGGKTAAASWLLERASGKGIPSIFLAHLDTLISDTASRLRSSGVRCGYVQAGRPVDGEALVQVCSMATLTSRDLRPPAGLVIVDECHRSMSTSVRDIIEAYPLAWILGLTATPQRGDGKPLGQLFEAIFSGPSNRWLTAEGFLVPCDIIAPRTFCEDSLNEDPVAAYTRDAPGTRAIVFASNVAHAKSLVERFEAAGFGAALLVGDTPRAERERVVAAMIDGSIKLLVGVDVFVEGFDLPCIETVVLARAFTVTGSFLQAIGRGLRPWPGKTRCTVLDLRGSVHLHGLPDEDRAWSIAGRACRRTETKIALRRCTECLAIFRVASVCPRCGFVATAAERVPRVRSRAEKAENLSHLTVEQRDERYLGRLRFVASTRMRMNEVRAERWARETFVRRFNRQPGEEIASP